MEIKFPYIKYSIQPPGKRKQHTYRPVIPVKLSIGNRNQSFDALIDSGADQCTFPGWIIRELGRDIHRGEQRIFTGIGGSVLTYLHKTKLRMANTIITINAFYSHEWDDMPFGLLGQEGFFSNFDIGFNYKQKMVSLRTC